MNRAYLETARLLTRVAPLVFVDSTFALKGGTAINLFVCDMPGRHRGQDRSQLRHAWHRPVRMASLSRNARDTLQADIEIPVVSFEDMYGGKLVAAMDRQHPRDLFDVLQLFAHEGITAGVRRAFVVYLASHNRFARAAFHPVS
jgi:Nucleotidyl transferase AbiEii toxin, Type IV TA system